MGFLEGLFTENVKHIEISFNTNIIAVYFRLQVFVLFLAYVQYWTTRYLAPK